jgi:hypothetical protein
MSLSQMKMFHPCLWIFFPHPQILRLSRMIFGNTAKFRGKESRCLLSGLYLVEKQTGKKAGLLSQEYDGRPLFSEAWRSAQRLHTK